MNQHNEVYAKMNDYAGQQQHNNGYITNQEVSGLFGGTGMGQSGQQFTVATQDTLQMLSQENTSKIRRINQQLALLRGKLFGECEVAKDKDPGIQAPMMSLQGSISVANDELLEAFQQLDSLVNRI